MWPNQRTAKSKDRFAAAEKAPPVAELVLFLYLGEREHTTFGKFQLTFSFLAPFKDGFAGEIR